MVPRSLRVLVAAVKMPLGVSAEGPWSLRTWRRAERARPEETRRACHGACSEWPRWIAGWAPGREEQLFGIPACVFLMPRQTFAVRPGAMRPPRRLRRLRRAARGGGGAAAGPLHGRGQWGAARLREGRRRVPVVRRSSREGYARLLLRARPNGVFPSSFPPFRPRVGTRGVTSAQRLVARRRRRRASAEHRGRFDVAGAGP